MHKTLVAIDPMALVLSPEMYEKWVELHHPHVMTQAEIDKIINAMSKQERTATLKSIESIMHTMGMMQKSLNMQH